MSSARRMQFVFSLLCLAGTPAAFGQPAPDPTAGFDVYGRIEEKPAIELQPLGDGSIQAQAPLSLFVSGEPAIRLVGDEARREVAFPVSPRVDIESVQLNLRHITSTGLVPETPHLRVSVNERAVAQLTGIRQPAIEVSSVTIDPDYIEPGYNRLWLDGIHRYTYECQNPLAPELWSEIDALGSELDIIYKRRPFTGRLSELTTIVSAGFGGVETLAVITPGDVPTNDQLKWGALGIQAFVNRADGAVPKIEHHSLVDIGPDSAGNFTGKDLIIVGLADELSPLLGETALKIDEAFLAITSSPYDETAFMLVISGQTPDEVSRAANTLTRMDYPLVDATEMRIPAGSVGDQVAPPYRPPLDAGVTYRLRDLGFRDISVRQKTFGTFQTNFLMPSDYFVAEGDTALLSLDLAYGADLREDSVVNVFLNGVFQRAVWLREPEGAVVPAYEVRVDARALRPGVNTFTFEVALTPKEGGQCGARSNRHLAFAMKDSSTLTLPPSSHFAELPDLSLLRDTGFPLVSHHGDLTAVRLLDERSETIAAAWTVIAKVHATTFSSPGDIDFGYGGDIPVDAHALFVGAAASLTGSGIDPEDVLQAQQGVRVGRTGALHAFKSLLADDRLNLILTASTSTQLLEATRTLVEPSHWSQLSGGHVEWRQLADTVNTSGPASTFQMGELETRTRIAFLNSKQPWGFVAMVALLLLALGVLLTIVVRYLRSEDTTDI